MISITTRGLLVFENLCFETWECPDFCSESTMRERERVPIIMFTGNAETPRDMDIRTSSRSPPIRIENAIQSGLKHPYNKNKNSSAE